jgi:hypothetical protein
MIAVATTVTDVELDTVLVVPGLEVVAEIIELDVAVAYQAFDEVLRPRHAQPRGVALRFWLRNLLSWEGHQPWIRRATRPRTSTISLNRPPGAILLSPARNRCSNASRCSPSASGDVIDLE